MPNGHGVPLGCYVCAHYQKGEPNPLTGRCQHHEIEVHMDLVCSDFDNVVNDAAHSDTLAEGILYAFVDVDGYSYPPPVELVPLARILEYKDWGDKQRKQAWNAAREQAKKIFTQRK